MGNAGYAEHSQQCVVSLAGAHKALFSQLSKTPLWHQPNRTNPPRVFITHAFHSYCPPEAQESTFPAIHPVRSGANLCPCFFMAPALCSCPQLTRRSRTEAAGKRRFLGVAKSEQRSAPEEGLDLSVLTADVSWRNDASRGAMSVKRGNHQSTCACHPKAAPRLRL